MGGRVKIGVRVGLLVLWVIVIFVITGYPSLKMPTVNEVPVDKVYHAIIFIILGFLEYPLLKRFSYFLVGGTIVVLAEFQQLIIPGREFDVFDMVSGMCGLIVVFLVIHWRSVAKDAVPKT